MCKISLICHVYECDIVFMVVGIKFCQITLPYVLVSFSLVVDLYEHKQSCVAIESLLGFVFVITNLVFSVLVIFEMSLDLDHHYHQLEAE